MKHLISKRLKATTGLLAGAALLIGASACTSGKSELADDGKSTTVHSNGKHITIGYINWDEDVAVSHLWQRILEDKGYDVTLREIGDAGPTYVGLAKGDLDLYLDSWLPSTHGVYWKKYGDQLSDLGTWYASAPLTIAVPTYLKDVNSLADLKSHADDFSSTITGIEPGAGETSVVKKMMSAYGLSGWKLQTSSTAGMLSALQKATKEKKPIVVDLWRPHWAYSTYPIKDLQDPKGAMGKPDAIHTVANDGFAGHYPAVAAMLKHFHMDDQSLGTLEKDVLVDNKEQPDKGVADWLKANPTFEKSLG